MINNLLIVTGILLIVVSLFWAHAEQKRELGQHVLQWKQILSLASQEAVYCTTAYRHEEWLRAYLHINKALCFVESLIQQRSIKHVSYVTGYDVELMCRRFTAMAQTLQQKFPELSKDLHHMKVLWGQNDPVNADSITETQREEALKENAQEEEEEEEEEEEYDQLP
jgi:ribosomal protein L12E/L44/L45/RPP1/RPP2